MNTSMMEAPASTLDPYPDQALLNPWPLYRELREMGPAVWLEKYRMFALTRYDAVMKALRDWEAFPSSFGVMMNDDMNRVLRGNTLCSDGDAHNRLRRVVMRPLTPVALKSLEDEVERGAVGVVDRLCGPRALLWARSDGRSRLSGAAHPDGGQRRRHRRAVPADIRARLGHLAKFLQHHPRRSSDPGTDHRTRSGERRNHSMRRPNMRTNCMVA
jgi:hypothetical protein